MSKYNNLVLSLGIDFLDEYVYIDYILEEMGLEKFLLDYDVIIVDEDVANEFLTYDRLDIIFNYIMDFVDTDKVAKTLWKDKEEKIGLAWDILDVIKEDVIDTIITIGNKLV